MSKKTTSPATSRHILIYDSDWEFLDRYFGAGAPRHRRVGSGYMCREYIHQAVQQLRQRMADAALYADDEEYDEELENA